MFKKIFCTSLFFLIFGSQIQAQDACGFDDLLLDLSRQSNYQNELDAVVHKWNNYLKDNNNPRRMLIEDADTVYEIPVVVHVFHTGYDSSSPFYKTDAQILEWIENTNAVLAGTAPGMLGPDDGGTKLPVRLVLAKRTPTCESTTGILRVDASSNSSFVSDGFSNTIAGPGVYYIDIMSMSRWDPKYYYNIYVVHKIKGFDGFSGSGTAGFAALPWSTAESDATVILASTVTPTNRILAHEFGHALGLYHPFQGVSSSSTVCPPAETEETCSSTGDYVCDTEVTTAIGWPCPTSADINPCTGLPFQGVQHNIMNYSPCVADRFTPGQRERVIFMLLEYRQGLMHSIGALETTSEDITQPLYCAPTGSLDFSGYTYSIGPTRVTLGDLDQISYPYYPWYVNHYENFAPNTCVDVITDVPDFLLGSTQSLYVQVILSQLISVYIDFNADGEFNEENELVYSSNSFTTGNIPFTIPDTANTESPLVMRIRTERNDISIPPIPNSCDNLYFGQTEDYLIKFVNDPLNLPNKQFTVTNVECESLLKWDITDDRYSIKTIEIEKSISGREFETIESYYIGQPSSQLSYVDKNVNNGQFMYRLKIMNSAGKLSYTPIEKVDITCNMGFVTFPNPTNGQVNVKYSSESVDDYVLTVYNILGSKIMEKKLTSHIGINQNDVDLSNQPNGIYIFKLSNSVSSFQNTITLSK